MKLEIKKKLLNRSERVKSVDLHPSLPWVLIGLYAGKVTIYDYNTQTQVRSFDITNCPVRCAKFIVRKQQIIVGSDDTKLRVFNYNTSEKLKIIEQHTDYIRHIVVHPSMPYVISCSDDDTIKMFDWEKNWQLVNTFQDHSHYIMQLAINPKDANMFASASLDRTIKFWTVGTSKSTANYSLVGHQEGVNCIDFSRDFERSQIVSGSDDGQVKIWDYQTKQCMFTFEQAHQDIVSAVYFHPDIPIIMSAGLDDMVNIWNAMTYKPETQLNYGLKAAWSIHALPESNAVAFGFDEGTVVIKIGKEIPLASFSNGKVIWCKQNEIQHTNLKLVQEELKDGEKVRPNVKELGQSETFATAVKFSPSGRFFSVCGDSEFVVYSYPKFQNSAFGNGSDLAWATVNVNQNMFAVRQQSGAVKVFKNLQDFKSFKTNFSCEGIFGGRLLAIKSKEFVTFYDWEQFRVVRRIDVNPAPKNILWSDCGTKVVLQLEDSFYLLEFNEKETEQALNDPSMQEEEDEDGFEEAFTFVDEYNETITSGSWVSNDCFVFINAMGSINYLIQGRIMKLGNAEKKQFILGYDSKQSRLYLVDKSLNIYAHKLLLQVLNFQTAILNKNTQAAQSLLKEIPDTYFGKLAKFLESNGQKEMAYDLTPDKDHKFELALALNKVNEAFQIAEETKSEDKWRKVGDIALISGRFSLAEQCFVKSQDFNSMLIFYSSCGNEEGLRKLVADSRAQGKYNVAFEAAYLLQDVDQCLEILSASQRYAEAAMFARAYAPSKLQQVTAQWGKMLKENGLQFQPDQLSSSEPAIKAQVEEGIKKEQELRTKFYEQARSEGGSTYTSAKTYYEQE